MCGIAGIVTTRPQGFDWPSVLKRMGAAISHRGPDSHDCWHDVEAGIGLAHRRLAILDLSANGNQPMHSASGRFVVSYNGEIFNFQALRTELRIKGHTFVGHSDTEVMLAAFEEWGVAGAVPRFVGMFAIALWDRRERTLSLVRDRFGIKPLHYTRQSHGLIFASELKSLRVVPGFSFVVDRNVLGSFVQKSYVPGVQTIYRSVFRVPPGHILTVRLDDLSAELQSQPYWSLPPISKHTSTRIDLPEQICVLDSLLRDAVSLRLLSDVPVGLFLSGGIDSSLVSAIAQNVSNVSLNTYSIGFDDKLYDEAAHAKKVAQVLGTNHLEMRLSERDVLDVVPMLPQVYDEPFGDSSQIPTMLLCSLARRHVTVALSGDGGDEMFAGYDRYFLAQRIWSLRKSLSAVGAAALGTAVTLAPVRLWDVMADVSRPFLPPRLRKPEFGSRVHRFANSLNSDDFASLYRSLTTRWNGLDSPVVLGAQGNIEKGDFHSCRQTELMDMMTRVDIGDFLPNDILTKLDRASMAVGLEARVPLLDHRVAEFAMKLPVEAKIKNGQSKLILRQLLQKYIPAEVWDRPKQGFNIPLTRWLRGPLRNWATALLDPVRINSEGFFDAAPIIFRWKEHLTGKRDWSPEIWNILMFQAWLEFNHPEQARN